MILLWSRVQTTFEHQNTLVTRQCLQVIGKYILWIDINLVANDKFVPVLVQQLSACSLREASADCIHDIICKGMDPILKTKLIESFSSVFASAGVWNSVKVKRWLVFIFKQNRL
jgi:exportin-T